MDSTSPCGVNRPGTQNPGWLCFHPSWPIWPYLALQPPGQPRTSSRQPWHPAAVKWSSGGRRDRTQRTWAWRCFAWEPCLPCPLSIGNVAEDVDGEMDLFLVYWCGWLLLLVCLQESDNPIWILESCRARVDSLSLGQTETEQTQTRDCSLRCFLSILSCTLLLPARKSIALHRLAVHLAGPPSLLLPVRCPLPLRFRCYANASLDFGCIRKCETVWLLAKSLVLLLLGLGSCINGILILRSTSPLQGNTWQPY